MSRHQLHDDIHEVLAYLPPAHPNEVSGKHEFIPGWPFDDICGACGYGQREESKDPYHYVRTYRRQTDQEAYLQSEHLEWLLAGKPDD